MSKHTNAILQIIAAGAILLLASCAHQRGPQRKTLLASEDPKPLPFAQNTISHVAATLETTPIHVEDDQTTEQKQVERDIELPARTSNKEDAESLNTPYPDNLIKSLPDPNTEVKVVLAFNAADLSEVVASFASPELLNFSYLIDPAVKGAVTLSVDTSMTAEQAWATFEHILWLSGAYASMNAGFIHILPFEKMPQERKLFAPEAQPNVVVDFAPIRYKKSADIANLIKPFMTEGATATDLADSNTLVIVEAPANIEKLRELIDRLDNRGEREWPCSTFQCHEVDAATVAEDLNLLLPVIGFPVATAAGTSGGAIKVVALPRVGCIVVSAALPEVVEEVGKWVTALDRSDLMAKEEIYFYNVTRTTVSRLADALGTFFNTEIVISSTNSTNSSRSTSRNSSANSMNSSSSNNNNNNSRNTTSTRTNNSRNSNNNQNTVDSQLAMSVFETPVTVFADEESNRLTIKTTPRTWNLIKAFLERHDVASRQVAIKAIIADVSLDKSTEFGVTYAAQKLASHGAWNTSGVWAGAGAATNLGGADEAIIDALNAWNSTGLGLIFQKAKDPLGIVTAVAGEGRTKILSEPQLVVVSGQQGKLQAGEQIAVPTQSTSYTSSSGNTSTNYEYKDIGVIMTVTPNITAGNEVRLEIEQEVTAVASSSTNTNGTAAPNFTKKDVSTVMTVKDNSTILMGGMIRNNEIITKSGIPFLRDIPYLGLLFGHDQRQNVRSELLILITVNVIDNENFQDELIRRYKESLEEIAKHQDDERY
ncbi:MAG: hypothetical protein MJ106_01785 [Lentisphaeria bacterium]|nr:hypothetical protein [Lentisphaeria bacterium]